MHNILGVGGCVIVILSYKPDFDRMVIAHEKGLRETEGLCIHDGGDEGDRTPDLLTASQALSQLSYAPVTRRYYRGRSSGMQGNFWIDYPPSR